MEYLIKAIDSKNYVLEQNQNVLGKLIYDSAFSCDKATVQIKDESIFRIENESNWSSDYIVKKGEQKLFKTKLNWSSELIISTLNQDNSNEYKLKAKGFWGDKHVLLDQTQNELFVVQSEYKWKKFNYEYSFKSTEAFQTIPYKEVLLFSVLQGLKKKTAFIAIFIIMISVMVTSN